MSYQKAKNLMFVDGRPQIYSASNNVRPLSYYWHTYPTEDNSDNGLTLFFYDLIARTVQFEGTNKKAVRINEIISNIEIAHKSKYPQCDENHGIGPYSLYQMLQTHRTENNLMTDPEFESHINMYMEQYREEKRAERKIYQTKWDEFSDHTEEMYQYFKNQINKI